MSLSSTPKSARARLLPALTGTGALLALLPAAAGQDLPRARAFGEVRSADGKPWSGATVRLWSVTSRADPTYEVDRVVVKTGADGRFRAMVLTGRSYQAWATMPAEGDSYRTTRLYRLQVQSPVVLEEEPGRFHRRTVGLVDAAGLKPLGPLRMALRLVWPERLNFDLATAMDGWRLPELPAGQSAWLTVYAGNGTSVDVGEEDTRTWAAPEPLNLALKPGRITFITRSLPRLEVIAGAEIYWTRGTRSFLVGATDANGDGVVPILQLGDDVPFTRVLVRKPGYRPVRPELDPRQPGYFVGMRRSAPDTATVRLDATTPAAGLLVEAPVPDYLWADGSDVVVASHLTDGNGRFRFDTDEPADGMLVAALQRRHIAALPESWRPGLSPRAVLGRSRKSSLGLQFVLAYTPPVDLRIETPDGAPAEGARVVFHTSDTHPLELFADRLGRLRIILPNRVPIGVGVEHRSGMGFPTVYRVAGDGPQSAVIRLVRTLDLSGRVVDREGRGVEGAFAMIHSLGRREVSEESPEPPPLRVSRGVQVVPARSAEAMARLVHRFVGAARSDAEGRFTMRMPDVQLRIGLVARHVAKDPSGRTHYASRVPVRVVRDSDGYLPVKLVLDELRPVKESPR